MRLVLVLAGYTIRELVRSKLLYNLLLFAVALITGSLLIAQLTIGNWARVGRPMRRYRLRRRRSPRRPGRTAEHGPARIRVRS
jgi:hypothetical protein